MAISPKDLIKKDDVDEAALAAIEAAIDVKLREFDEIRPGCPVAISFPCTDTVSRATAKSLKRLYEKAGWREVQINRIHSIISMTCPLWRGRVARSADPDDPNDGPRPSVRPRRPA